MLKIFSCSWFPISKNQARYSLGKRSEGLCAFFLKLKGYRILYRRFKTPGGEIDIIAQRRKTIAIIEVKARHNFEDAVSALTSYQQHRIYQATRYFLSHHPLTTSYSFRFDIMVVLPKRFPIHLKDAWHLTM